MEKSTEQEARCDATGSMIGVAQYGKQQQVLGGIRGTHRYSSRRAVMDRNSPPGTPDSALRERDRTRRLGMGYRASTCKVDRRGQSYLPRRQQRRGGGDTREDAAHAVGENGSSDVPFQQKGVIIPCPTSAQQSMISTIQ